MFGLRISAELPAKAYQATIPNTSYEACCHSSTIPALVAISVAVTVGLRVETMTNLVVFIFSVESHVDCEGGRVVVWPEARLLIRTITHNKIHDSF